MKTVAQAWKEELKKSTEKQSNESPSKKSVTAGYIQKGVLIWK